ncbi:efflux RND transporter permease subunit [Patescibacteria group bacterium]|nr:efflux RND transporter permease subunit [Patescibacteria group bacterium]
MASKTSKPKQKQSLNFFAKWAKFFIDKYKITIILLIALMGLGVYGAVKNQRQDFPPISINYVFISAVYPGASPEVVASEAINPIENAIKGHTETSRIRSSASPSYGMVIVELKSFGEDVIDKTVTDFKELVNGAGLSKDIEVKVATEDVGGPSLAYVLSSDSKSFDELIEAAPKVKEYLEKESKEVKQVDIAPKAEFEIRVELDAEKLAAARLDVSTVKQAVESNLTVLPGGSVEDESDNITKQINIVKPTQSLDDVKNIILPSGQKLTDIAEVKREPVAKDSLLMAGYIDENGQAQYSDQAVYLMLMKEADGDVIRMKEDIDKAVASIYEKDALAEDIDINLTYDSSSFVKSQIDSLLRNGLIGLVIILIVFMFFIDIRTGIVVGLIIPIAFLITLFILNQIGYSINILTTFAMILTLGILVDNAIVIAEGIQHRLQKYGETKLMAALKSVRDLGPAVTTATLTTIVVFIPFANMGGFMGEILKYIPYTIIIMLIVSYFLAISITPLLGKWILKEQTEAERQSRKLKKWQKYLILPMIIFYGQRLVDGMVRFYGRAMTAIHKRWLLKIGILVLVAIGLVGSVSLVAIGKIPSAQFPVTDSEQFTASATFPTGTEYETKKQIMSDLMKEVVKVPYFEGSFVMQGQIFTIITAPEKRSNDKDTTVYTIVDELNKRVDPIRERAPAGTNISIGSQSYGPPEAASDVIIEVKNDDAEAIAKTVAEIDRFVQEKNDNGGYKIDQIANDLKDNLIPSVEITFDKDKLKQYGVAPLTTSLIVNSVFSESEVGKVTVREDGVQDKVSLAFNENSKNSVDDVKKISVLTATGKPVALEEIAEVKTVDKANSIDFIDGSRAVSYKLALDIEDQQERSKEAALLEADIKNNLTTEKLDSYGLEAEDISYGGFAAEIASDFEKLFVIFIIAIIAVYLILVFQFGSYVQPMMILMAIPIALVGVFPGIWLVGSSLDLISGLGIIALVGIVVNDAIVFIDYFNRQRRKYPDWPLVKTLVYTGQVRFKPIFSTSITTMAAILPLTIQDPFWRGLGTAIVAGLLLATIGNLVVLPIVIAIFEKMKRWVREKRTGCREARMENGE